MNTVIGIISVTILIVGCGTASFQSESEEKSQSGPSMIEDFPVKDVKSPDSQITDSITPPGEIPIDLDKEDEPMPPSEVSAACPSALESSDPNLQPLEIYAAVSVLDNGGYSLIDEGTTEKNQLIIVRAAVNSLTDVKYLLANPNGIYCIITQTNVLSTLTIEVHKDAKLFLSAVSVNVQSDIRIKKIEPEGNW